MKQLAKYFLAFVPKGTIQEKAQILKDQIKSDFGVKYALKSPAHVTVKMPFIFNEKKEQVLIESIQNFTRLYEPFSVQVSGLDTFGRRVIFWDILPNSALHSFQSDLKVFCKRELKLVDELADNNYHPHMTIAFKDLKEKNFDNVMELVRKSQISDEFLANELSLLKRIEDRWVEISRIKMKAPEN